MKSKLVRSMNKYVKLERTYCNKSQLETIYKYCKELDYNLKYKILNVDRVIKDKKITQDMYFDLIIEKKINDNKTRHGFISILNDNIYLSYKKLSENITYLVTSIPSNLKEDARVVFEPIMFIKFNVN